MRLSVICRTVDGSPRLLSDDSVACRSAVAKTRHRLLVTLFCA